MFERGCSQVAGGGAGSLHPVVSDQSQMILSSPVDASTERLVGEKLKPITQSVWPESVRVQWPVAVIQILMVVSLPPDATVTPEGSKASTPTEPVCPIRTWSTPS